MRTNATRRWPPGCSSPTLPLARFACRRHRYCRIGNLVDAGIAQRQSASVYLETLVGIGVLNEVKVGRERLFANLALLALLTGDAEG